MDNLQSGGGFRPENREHPPSRPSSQATQHNHSEALNITIPWRTIKIVGVVIVSAIVLLIATLFIIGKNHPTSIPSESTEVPLFTKTPTESVVSIDNNTESQKGVDTVEPLTIYQHPSVVDSESHDATNRVAALTPAGTVSTIQPSVAEPITSSAVVPEQMTKESLVSPSKKTSSVVQTSPEQPTKPAPVLKTEAVKKIATSYYTIQLSGSTTRSSLESLAQRMGLRDYRIDETKRAGKTWFVLLNGHYDSYHLAKQAIMQLPEKIKAEKPWIKQIKQPSVSS